MGRTDGVFEEFERLEDRRREFQGAAEGFRSDEF